MSIPDKLKRQLEKMYLKDNRTVEQQTTRSMSDDILHRDSGKVMSSKLDNSPSKMEINPNHQKNNRIAGQGTVGQPNSEEKQIKKAYPSKAHDTQTNTSQPQSTEPQARLEQENPSQLIPENVTTTKQNEEHNEDHNRKIQVNEADFNANHASTKQQSEKQELNEVQSNTGYLQIEDISGQENRVKPRPVQIDSIPEEVVSYDNYVDISKCHENIQPQTNKEYSNEGESMSAKDKPNNITPIENRQDKPNKEQFNSIQIKQDEDIPIQIREEQQIPDEVISNQSSEQQDNQVQIRQDKRIPEDITPPQETEEQGRIFQNDKKKVELTEPFDSKAPDWVNEEEDNMQEEETKPRLPPIGTPPPAPPVSPQEEFVPSVQQQTQAQQFVEEEQKELEQDEQEGYEQFQKDEFLSEDEARAKIATMLIDRDNRETMSELNDYEIFQLSIVNAVAKDFGIAIVQQWANELLDFKVSRGRAGRLEVKEVAAPSVKREQDKKSVMDMIMGGRKF